jgi:tRNA U34 5-methylaminomethyl-2-thiouridine-forming methyltransferase MnmC
VKILLTHDGSRTLYSAAAGECYHSRSGAWTESRFVYLQNSGAWQRLETGLTTRILEIGLGSGLNFLLSADAAHGFGTPLQYVGVDTRPLESCWVRELGYGIFLQNPDILDRWLAILDGESVPGRECTIAPGVSLTPWYAEATKLVQDEACWPAASFDIVYLDAFCPTASPELWTRDFLGQLWRLLKPGGILASYCVKSLVRKRMLAAGFEVHCPAGPEGGKRQILQAVKSRRRGDPA